MENGIKEDERSFNVKDLLVLLVLVSIMYVIARVALKEPIIPGRGSKKKGPTRNFKKKKSQDDDDGLLEDEPIAPFKDLFHDVVTIETHMIRRENNNFSLMAEVEPVNYFLLDAEEQEAIDVSFETWTAQLNYPVRIYLQNRFIDMTEPVEDIENVMNQQEDLHPDAIEFGQNMIQNLKNWQRSQPRYETKRYLIFDIHIDEKDIRAEDEEELEQKILDKAFNELHRRLMTARQQLRKAEMNVVMLTTEGIGEVLYYAFNRRKAVKNRFRDIERQEQLALFVTADQTENHIIHVKGAIEDASNEVEETISEEKPAS